MANTLKPKRSSVAGNIPTTTNLASGEVAVNMADQKVWINNGTSVVQVGSGKLSGLADVVLSSLATGQGLSWNGTNWVNSSAGSGSVTSVAWNLPSIFTTSGSPITTSGTLTATLASQTANTVFAAPNGAAGAPTFRSLVAADIPTLNQSTTGSSGSTSRLATPDTRNTSLIPTDLSAGLVTSFQTNTSDGLSDGGTYNGLWSFRQYSSGGDWSGGAAHQLGFTDNGNIWHRTGSSATWGAWQRLIDSANYSSYALPLSGGTLSGVITTVSSGTAINFSGQSDSFGYNATAGLGTYIKGTGSTYLYGGGSFFDGSSQRVLLHAGNYNSYSLPLTGGALSGVLTINSTSDNQLLLQSTDSWTGIGFNDSAPLATDYIWHNGTNGTFALGGGGANVAGKKLHVHGGMTVGANYAATTNPTNGLNVEGAIQQAGNQVLHAGNYNSYALPLTGGTTTGSVRLGGGNSTPAGTTFSNTIAGIGANNFRVVNFDGNGSRPSVWWTNGSRALFAIDALDAAGASFWANDGTNWQQQMSVNYGSVNVNTSLQQGGNQVLHAGNYTSYINNTYVRSIGAASTSNNWDSLGNTYPNTVEQIDTSNFTSTANGPTAASYQYGLLLNLAANSAAQAQIYISHAGNDLIFRGGWNGASWQTWNKVLTNQNFSSYSPTLTGGNASGTWGINITGNANTATTLQTSRTINGIPFNGSAAIDTTEWFHSDRDFPSGTLITTNINYAVSSGDPFVLEIRGNSYGNIVPLDLLYQGYIYADTIINHGGLSNGLSISGLVAINNGGNLCFWFPSQGYWNGYNVKVYSAYATRATNRVTSITGVAKPTTAKEVALSANIRQSLHSGNFTSYSPSLTGAGASGTWNISITGSVASSNAVNGLTLTSSANGINPDSVTQNQLGYNGSVSLFGQTDGGLYSSAHSSSWIHQIYGDFRTGQIATRGKNSGTWQAWRVQLDSGNFSSYALPLSGGTIAGNGFIDFGPNSGWAATLRVGGNGHGGSTRASVATTNGNLHLDGTSSRGVYLNWYNASTEGTFFGNGASGQVGRVDGGGNATFSGNVSGASDERLKTDWEVLPADYIERLAKVKSGTYTRLDSGARQAGASAQDMQKLLKETVMTADDEAGTLSLAYGNAALVSAIELAKDNVDLRARVAKLEALISQLIEG